MDSKFQRPNKATLTNAQYFSFMTAFTEQLQSAGFTAAAVTKRQAALEEQVALVDKTPCSTSSRQQPSWPTTSRPTTSSSPAGTPHSRATSSRLSPRRAALPAAAAVAAPTAEAHPMAALTMVVPTTAAPMTRAATHPIRHPISYPIRATVAKNFK